jgi:hypothetical protein
MVNGRFIDLSNFTSVVLPSTMTLDLNGHESRPSNLDTICKAENQFPASQQTSSSRLPKHVEASIFSDLPGLIMVESDMFRQGGQ